MAGCPSCVAGKLANPPHRRVEEYGRTVPEVGIDCGFMKDSEGEESLTILVMKDRDSKAIFSDVVELKGRGIAGTVERVIENLKRLGHNM